MHLDFTISIGQIATILAILGTAWGFSTKINRYLIEHELLIQKYCMDTGIEPHELPTRVRR